MQQEAGNILISIVTPVRNESENLPHFYERIERVMTSLGHAWELICVYDESSDDTFDVLMTLRAQDPRIKIINLSRGFGKEIAITAGLDFAKGDAAILIDSDLQDPPELISEMVEQWKQGNNMVYAVRTSRSGESWLKKRTASWFYQLMDKISMIHIHKTQAISDWSTAVYSMISNRSKRRTVL